MRRFIILFFILLNLAGFSQNRFEIEITLPRDYIGTKFFLTKLDNDMRKVLHQDSLIISNTNFSLEGNLNEDASFFRVDIIKGRSYVSKKIILNSGSQKLDILLSEFPKAGGAPLKTTCSTNAQLVLDSLESIRIDYYKRLAKKEQGYSFLETKDMLLLNIAKMKFLERYAEDYFALLILFELSAYSRTADYQEKILSTLNLFSDHLKNSYLGKNLANDAIMILDSFQAINVGARVPYFSIKRDNGMLFSNTSIKGKPYLLVFSATWCLPCQKELPTLKSLYEKYKNKGLKIVYINLDDDRKKWISHIKNNNISSWLNVSEELKARDSKIGKLFNVNSVPAYFLIDKNELIVADSKLEKQYDLPNLTGALSKIVF